jgi:acetyl-CoA synthetase
MFSENFTVSLGNNNSEIRKKADENYILFWDTQAKNLFWFKTWDKTLVWEPPFAKWFDGGLINASYNTLDIHQ